MPLFRDHPDAYASLTAGMRRRRWITHMLRQPKVAEALSWLAWLLCVGAFAVWTHLYYRAPSGPGWIGMTIRTAAFAIWTQILREWLVSRVAHRR